MRISDWSSDVCSSDLPGRWAIEAQIRREGVPDQMLELVHSCQEAEGDEGERDPHQRRGEQQGEIARAVQDDTDIGGGGASRRSEERRVGEECVSTVRCGWRTENQKKKKARKAN